MADGTGGGRQKDDVPRPASASGGSVCSLLRDFLYFHAFVHAMRTMPAACTFFRVLRSRTGWWETGRSESGANNLKLLGESAEG